MVLGLDVGVAAAGVGRGEGRRGGSEKLLEDGHDEEHGDEDGGGDEPKRHRINGVVEVGPVVVFLNVQRRTARRRRPAAPPVVLRAHKRLIKPAGIELRRQKAAEGERLRRFGKKGKAFSSRVSLAVRSCHQSIRFSLSLIHTRTHRLRRERVMKRWPEVESFGIWERRGRERGVSF